MSSASAGTKQYNNGNWGRSGTNVQQLQTQQRQQQRDQGGDFFQQLLQFGIQEVRLQ